MTQENTSIRCSSLDSLWACAPSAIGGGVIQVSVGSKAQAEAGKVLHSLLADFITNGEADYKAAFDRAGVPQADEWIDCFNYGVKAYGELAKYLPTPRVEIGVTSDTLAHPNGTFNIRGTIDVLSPRDDNTAVFVDWKSGFVDDGYAMQMYGYAYCIWCEMGRPVNTTIVGIVVFLQHHYYRVVKYTTAMLEAWEFDLTHNVMSKQELYRPGDQCRYCTKFATCEGRKVYVNSIVDAFVQPDGTSEFADVLAMGKELLAGLTAETKDSPEVGRILNDIVVRVKVMEHECEKARAMVKETVARVGPVPTLNGYQLEIRPVEVKSLDSAKAIRTLRTRLSDEQITGAMKLSLPKLLASYASNHMRGEKKAAKEQLTKELDDCGALIVNVQHRLEENPIDGDNDVESACTGTDSNAESNAGGQPDSL